MLKIYDENSFQNEKIFICIALSVLDIFLKHFLQKIKLRVCGLLKMMLYVGENVVWC